MTNRQQAPTQRRKIRLYSNLKASKVFYGPKTKLNNHTMVKIANLAPFERGKMTDAFVVYAFVVYYL
jgi:hypothetical protein